MKKVLSIILALTLILSCMTAFTAYSAERPYGVFAYDANTNALTGTSEIYTDSNKMTLGEDGNYSVTFNDVPPTENIILDVSDLTLGDAMMGFYGFNFCAIDVTKTCDVTVYYKCDLQDLDNSRIWATGDGVVIRTKPLIEDLYVYSNWAGYNCSDTNRLVEVDEYVYQCKFENLTAGKEYQFEIYNQQSLHRDIWGCDYHTGTMELGIDHDATMYPFYYATDIINFEVPYTNSNVTITLDLTEFDYVSKNGATFRIDATDMRGDLNVDGIVSIIDATDVQKGLADLITLTDNQKISADVNGDGEVTVVDATIIQKYIAGLCESFDNIA